MQNVLDGLPQKETFKIKQLLVDGNSAPNAEELIEALSKIDLVEEFKDTVIVDSSIFTLSFDSSDHAHLFALDLGAQGHGKGIFIFLLPDSFFQNDLLDDFRVDGTVLGLSEEIKNNRSEVSIVLRQGSKEYRHKLSELVKEVISSSIPGLADEVSGLEL